MSDAQLVADEPACCAMRWFGLVLGGSVLLAGSRETACGRLDYEPDLQPSKIEPSRIALSKSAAGQFPSSSGGIGIATVPGQMHRS